MRSKFILSVFFFLSLSAQAKVDSMNAQAVVKSFTEKTVTVMLSDKLTKVPREAIVLPPKNSQLKYNQTVVVDLTQIKDFRIKIKPN